MAKTVLLVEDEAVLRSALKVILESEGYQVYEACNGEAAFKELISHKIDMVITDIQMPVMDGFELLQKIKNLPAEKPSVIVMTGYSKYSENDFFEAGAFAYLQKPFSPEFLLESLNTHGQQKAV